MIIRISLFIAALCLSFHVRAQDSSKQADSFANIYATTCFKHLSSLEALERQLESVPSLPPEKAQHFLAGKKGKAWPVPDKHGTFVLSIHTDKNFCAVYARRVSGSEAISRFQKMVATAPPPFMARQVEQTSYQTKLNGMASTLSYEWSLKGSERKLLFTLSTADSPTADIQGLVSAAIIR